jgi:hypothetical protein
MSIKQITENVARKGTLLVQLFSQDGKLKEERKITNLMTNAGEAHIADQLSSAPDESALSHMAIGTGTTDPTSAQTALVNEIDRNALTSRTQGAGGDDNDVIYVGDWAAADGTGAIAEAGIFNSSAAGIMLCRSTFAVINKGASDTLKITWTVTIGAS